MGDQIVLTVGYERDSLTNSAIRAQYHGEVSTDWYGRSVPKHAHGTLSLGRPTSSSQQIIHAVTELYDRIVNSAFLRVAVPLCSEIALGLCSEKWGNMLRNMHSRYPHKILHVFL